MNIDDRFTKPPIIIGGCGRSGTSLLLAILSAHPSIYAIPEETEAFCPTAYATSTDPNAPFEIGRIRERLRSADIPNTVTRWCEKTPKNILFFRRILNAFGANVRLINIVRDGRDVITSRHPKNPQVPWIGISRWVHDLTAGLPFDEHPQVLVIRYEDLALRFTEQIRRINQFLEEETDDRLIDWHQHTSVRNHLAWLSSVRELHTQSIGRWRRAEHCEAIAEMMSDPAAVALLRHYGYVPLRTKPVGRWNAKWLIRRMKRKVPQPCKRYLKALIS